MSIKPAFTISTQLNSDTNQTVPFWVRSTNDRRSQIIKVAKVF